MLDAGTSFSNLEQCLLVPVLVCSSEKIYVEKQQPNTNSLLQTTLGSLPYAQRHGDIRFQITVFPARGVAALCTVQTKLLRKN